MANCDFLLAQEISSYCDKPLAKGAYNEAVIINRNDIDFNNCTVDIDGSIGTIVLKSGKHGYKCLQPGNKPFGAGNTALVVGEYQNTWTHQLPIIVLAHDAEVVSGIIEKLAHGEFVVVVKLKNTGNASTANGRYQIFGFDNGMRASEQTHAINDDALGSGWSTTLQEEGALRAARFLVATTAEATEKSYEALVQGGSNTGDGGSGSLE